jgi:hypothetical protein
MTLEQFKKLIDLHRQVRKDLGELHDIGVDLFEGRYKISDHFENMMEIFVTTNFGELGWEWVSWFIYETDYQSGKKYEAYDENAELICQDVEGLYNYISQWKK